MFEYLMLRKRTPANGRNGSHPANALLTDPSEPLTDRQIIAGRAHSGLENLAWDNFGTVSS